MNEHENALLAPEGGNLADTLTMLADMRTGASVSA
jgi:hypothetical protein